MAVTIYTDDGRTEKKIIEFDPEYNEHIVIYSKQYKKTECYKIAETPLHDMVNHKRITGCIDSKIEISKILKNIGNDFLRIYTESGFTIEYGRMLGMQLFEICVNDNEYNWWFHIPKPKDIWDTFPHSIYYLKI